MPQTSPISLILNFFWQTKHTREYMNDLKSKRLLMNWLFNKDFDCIFLWRCKLLANSKLHMKLFYSKDISRCDLWFGRDRKWQENIWKASLTFPLSVILDILANVAYTRIIKSQEDYWWIVYMTNTLMYISVEIRIIS